MWGYCSLSLRGEVPILVGVMLVKVEEEKHNFCDKIFRNTADLDYHLGLFTN